MLKAISKPYNQNANYVALNLKFHSRVVLLDRKFGIGIGLGFFVPVHGVVVFLGGFCD